MDSKPFRTTRRIAGVLHGIGWVRGYKRVESRLVRGFKAEVAGEEKDVLDNTLDGLL